MKRISVFFALLSMSLLMAMGQININGIEYEIYSYLKEINGKKIKTEVALIKSASTTLSGSVTIPSQISYKGKMYDVMTISRNAFNDCSSITSINIASGIQYIGEYAFKNCTGLTSFKKPGTLSKLGDGAFYNCCNLVSIELPEINAYESLIELHSELFYGCSNLVYVKIPSTVRIIGEDVFYKCTSLTDIFCYSTKVPRIRYNSFDGTNPKNIKIHVPKEALADYQSSIWNQFKIIDANMTRPQVQKPVIKQNVNSNTREAIDMGGSIEWANMNLESKSIQDPGGIFAWGETTSKSEFTRSNYTEPKVPGKFEYEKYNNGLRGTNYDAARVKWGDGWRLPSKNEYKELIGKCEQIRHKGYVEFIAPNGNRLIFPLLEWTNITYNGIDNFYWTLDLDEYGPICCTFSKGSYDISGSGAISTSYERKRTSFCKVEPISGHYGGFIRPVRNKGSHNHTGGSVQRTTLPKDTHKKETVVDYKNKLIKDAGSGDFQAQKKLAQLYSSSNEKDRDIDKAVNLYTALAIKGDKESQNALCRYRDSALKSDVICKQLASDYLPHSSNPNEEWNALRSGMHFRQHKSY